MQWNSSSCEFGQFSSIFYYVIFSVRGRLAPLVVILEEISWGNFRKSRMSCFLSFWEIVGNIGSIETFCTIIVQKNFQFLVVRKSLMLLNHFLCCILANQLFLELSQFVKNHNEQMLDLDTTLLTEIRDLIVDLMKWFLKHLSVIWKKLFYNSTSLLNLLRWKNLSSPLSSRKSKFYKLLRIWNIKIDQVFEKVFGS